MVHMTRVRAHLIKIQEQGPLGFHLTATYQYKALLVTTLRNLSRDKQGQAVKTFMLPKTEQ